MPLDPDKIIIGPAQLSIDGTNVGYTSGGVTLRKSEDYIDIEADQLKGVARKEITSERMFLNTTLLESTLENLRLAMAEATSQTWSGSALGFGSANPVVVEHTLTVTGKGVDGKNRTYTFYRAVKVDEVEHMIGARDQVSQIPIGFELLKDPDQGNKFGLVSEVPA